MINLIVATSENGCIGRDGLLPWKKQKSDMKNFRALTLGHPVIMGRKTYESIPFDLDERHQIVLTRSGKIGHGQNFCGFGNTSVVSTVEEALRESSLFNVDPFVIGGSEVYNLFLPVVDRIFRTIIHTEVEGDSFFYVPEGWTLLEENRHSSDTNNKYDYTYQLFQRATGS